MKKNATLTKAEEATIYKATEIIRAWCDAHMEDKDLPPNFWDIYGAGRDIEQHAWAMCDPECARACRQACPVRRSRTLSRERPTGCTGTRDEKEVNNMHIRGESTAMGRRAPGLPNADVRRGPVASITCAPTDPGKFAGRSTSLREFETSAGFTASALLLPHLRKGHVSSMAHRRPTGADSPMFTRNEHVLRLGVARRQHRPRGGLPHRRGLRDLARPAGGEGAMTAGRMYSEVTTWTSRS